MISNRRFELASARPSPRRQRTGTTWPVRDYFHTRALNQLESFRPDIVLLDLEMPGFHGLDVCRRIRSSPSGRSLFIVAVTGWGQDEDRRRTRQAGFDGHLVKPVAPEDLLNVVENARTDGDN